MILITLGIVILVGVYILKLNNPDFTLAGKLRILAVACIGIGAFMSTIKQINSGEIGVNSLFGKVNSDILPSGLNFVNPFATITTFDTKTQNYTMSAVHSEGDKEGDDAIRVLSADGLEVIIDITVLFRINPVSAPSILKNTGEDYKEKIVRPVTRTRIRDNSVYFDAVSLYSTRRNEFQNKIFQNIESDFTKRGLILESVLIRNINLPASVKATIESKINAEQESQKMQFVLAKEKQEAERKRVEAQGIADYQKIVSSGLNDKMLQYEQIKAQKELATSNNSKVIVLGKSSSNIMINDK
ncbi:MAG: prohibitin family protein [Leadbetterella sp.]